MNDPTQYDPMVIIVEIDKFAITKVLVDQGSSRQLIMENFQKNEDYTIRNPTL